jgi:hypothetical protein
MGIMQKLRHNIQQDQFIQQLIKLIHTKVNLLFNYKSIYKTTNKNYSL